MSGHVWTQVDMLIDPASGLKKSNWFAYHFRIPLYHTSAKRIRNKYQYDTSKSPTLEAELEDEEGEQGEVMDTE